MPWGRVCVCVEVEDPLFTSSSLGRVAGLLHSPVSLSPRKRAHGTHWKAEWAPVHSWERRMFCSSQESNYTNFWLSGTIVLLARVATCYSAWTLEVRARITLEWAGKCWNSVTECYFLITLDMVLFCKTLCNFFKPRNFCFRKVHFCRRQFVFIVLSYLYRVIQDARSFFGRWWYRSWWEREKERERAHMSNSEWLRI